MKKLVVLALAITMLNGCSVGMVRFDQIMVEKVTRKAVFDLQCSKSELTISKIDNGAYGVIGCNKRSTYVGANSMICHKNNTESNLDSFCNVVPDTFFEN